MWEVFLLVDELLSKSCWYEKKKANQIYTTAYSAHRFWPEKLNKKDSEFGNREL